MSFLELEIRELNGEEDYTGRSPLLQDCFIRRVHLRHAFSPSSTAFVIRTFFRNSLKSLLLFNANLKNLI